MNVTLQADGVLVCPNCGQRTIHPISSTSGMRSSSYASVEVLMFCSKCPDRCSTLNLFFEWREGIARLRWEEGE